MQIILLMVFLICLSHPLILKMPNPHVRDNVALVQECALECHLLATAVTYHNIFQDALVQITKVKSLVSVWHCVIARQLHLLENLKQ